MLRSIRSVGRGQKVITQAEVIKHDKHGMCKYTITQDDGGEEFDVRFHHVAPCDRHHVWDRLVVNKEEKRNEHRN